MKKNVIIFAVFSFIVFIVASIVVIVYISVSVLIVLYNKKQEIKPTISMPYKIDTLDFKLDGANNYVDFHFEKPHGVGTISGSFFNDRCYVSIITDTIKFSSILIDTGSDDSFFDINNNLGEEYTITNIWGNPLPARRICIDTIVLGKTIYNTNGAPFYYSKHISNVIGGNILKHFVWKIDNLHKKVYFSQDTSAFLCNDCIAVPFDFKANIPFTKCYVNGKLHNVMLDTGYSGFLHIVDKTSVEESLCTPHVEPRDSFFCTTLINDILYDSTEVDFIRQKEYRTISDINIENISFNNEIVEHNIYFNNLLGWDFFQRFEYVVFDYINQVMYLGPISELKSFTYLRNLRTYINAMGIQSTISNPSTILLITDSLEEVGLSLGDTIIAIDKEPVTNMELLKLLYSRKSATITVKNGNGESDYTLYRSHYLSEPDTVMTYGEVALFPLYRNMLSFYLMNDDGFIFKYYNWNPPYLIGDQWRIFD